MTPVMDSAAATVKPLIEERKHTLHVSIDRGNLWVNADPTRLEQVIVNLLNNAAKYSENEGQVWLTAGNEGKDVVISVKDQGVGIVPEKLPQMFELFAQGDRSLARSEGGLGIGLTVVKKLVEMHGGRVTAESEGPGKGSEFTIRLPAARARSSTPPRRPEQRRPRAGSPEFSSSTIAWTRPAEWREFWNFSVTRSPRPTPVPRPSKPPSCTAPTSSCSISDFRAWTATRSPSRLRHEKHFKETFIVAVSGYGQEEDIRRSRKAGFDHHLIKPLDLESLISLLSVCETAEGGREAPGKEP